jgi:putative ABC transport system permease protein
MKTGMEQAIADARADVLFVRPAAFGGMPLPVSYLDRLKSIPGVNIVSFADGFLGTYQKPDQAVYVLTLDTSKNWLTLIPEVFSVSSRDLDALQRTRTGALINADIGKKYGWHVGDRISLASNILQSNGSGTWVFDIVGTFSAHEVSQGSYIVANYTYLDEARAAGKGTVRNFYVVVSDPKEAASVSETIDRAFANSSNETQTVSFKELAQQQMQAIGDLNFVIRSIVSAVLVALLFSISTMMMQTIRERTPELAVLKTLGFTDRAVFGMVMVESLVVCIAAALIGLALSAGVFPYAAKFVPGLSMPMIVIAFGVMGAVCIALISAAVPASRAARLAVVDALAGR